MLAYSIRKRKEIRIYLAVDIHTEVIRSHSQNNNLLINNIITSHTFHSLLFSKAKKVAKSAFIPITAFGKHLFLTTQRKEGIRIPNDKHFPEWFSGKMYFRFQPRNQKDV
jgi:hypothetical protein